MRPTKRLVEHQGIVVFAHVPPPHHGQSAMVKLMLNALRSSSSKNLIHHVDARVSDGMADLGGFHPKKIFRLLHFCIEAIWLRFSRGATTLYYIPAPPKTSAILRDLLSLTLLRPFFPRVILHWHAVGLGNWVQRGGWVANWLRFLLRGADPAIVIAEGNAGDAEVFCPRSLTILPNGIPDPCPDFGTFRHRRLERSETVRSWLDARTEVPVGGRIRVLYLGHCTRSKGLFDSLEALMIASKQRPHLKWELSIGGEFVSSEEKESATKILSDLQARGVDVRYLGYLHNVEKVDQFLSNDILLFPSYSESFGLVAVEALACGLPVCGTDIPGLQAVLRGTGCRLVSVHSPTKLAEALQNSEAYRNPSVLRERFNEEFQLDRFTQRIRNVFFEDSREFRK